MPRRSSADKEARRNEAVKRNKDWKSLSLKHQLESLDARLGKDVGATKQRARIKKLIEDGHEFDPKKN